ncbi:hypothetical protein R3P38DRAFT_2807229 [Favolaschia claudopus]|uniref:Ribonuclease H1 N-terminal domain-containing protein n=1 Tax=Favolaschia claudopus TaxID=2862362 RepID=A0AAV9ZI57_9AGAR
MSSTSTSQPAHSDAPRRLSLNELERLSANLSDDEVDALIDRMGAATLIAQLPPALLNLVHHLAQDMSASDPQPDSTLPPVAQPVPSLPASEQNADSADSIADSALESESSLTTSEYASAEDASPSEESSSDSEITTTYNISDLEPEDSDPELPPSSPETQRRGPIPGYVVHSPEYQGVVMTWFKAGALTQGVPNSRARALRPRKQPPHPKRLAYTIFYGGEVGVFTEWPRVAELTKGHGVAIHQGFPSVEAAQSALDYARERGWTRDSTPPDSAAAPPPGNDDNNPLAVGAQDRCLNISGVSGSLFASYPTRAEADTAYAHAVGSRFMCPIPRTRLF